MIRLARAASQKAGLQRREAIDRIAEQQNQQNKQQRESPTREPFDTPLNTGSHNKGSEQKADSLTGQRTVAPAESIKERISGLLVLR